ncbi:MAG: response regulator [Bryobacteraceae bacterium]|nr:response regulator [Bryobacteraceae bacterium]
MGLAARRAVLQELGYEVETCISGDHALAALGEREFQLLITDYKLPDGTGQALIAKARKKQTEIKVILLSGYADALGLHENNTGADIVIQKSANEVSTLVRAVKKLLKPSRQTAKARAAAAAKHTAEKSTEKKPMSRVTPAARAHQKKR